MPLCTEKKKGLSSFTMKMEKKPFIDNELPINSILETIVLSVVAVFHLTTEDIQVIYNIIFNELNKSVQ